MKKAYLIILDGFGLGDHTKGDAVYNAHKPYIHSLFKKYPMSKLKTDGEYVGLPSFQTGGSEVGHITIGAGRAVKHLLTKINDQIDSGEFFQNHVLKKLFRIAKERKRIHFVGLTSDGGIHSFLPHLFGLQKMAKDIGISDVFIHAFLDGRDVGERTAKTYLQQIEDQKKGTLASLGGRFFGMDRDTNWDREERAYRVLCHPDTKPSDQSWERYLDTYYTSSEKSDYYVPPVLFRKEGQILSDDVVIFFNYRTDRARQISSALCDNNFSEFEVPVQISSKHYGIFGPYYEEGQQPFCFDEESIPLTLGEIISRDGGRQLRISETEKFNHVTFFFSGQRKEKFKGEERILIPSPKCASYAEKPEMSAKEQTEAALRAIEKTEYNLVVQNFANADLVGHSGKLSATVKAVELLDECLKKLVPYCLEKKYEVFITADHGNSDSMILPNGEENAAHTKNFVPFVWVSDRASPLKEKGDLRDIAPTLLECLEKKVPNEMTGESLCL
jgi:2,3-bisphosphoglycerate-independent phosphoglycerate mutase